LIYVDYTAFSKKDVTERKHQRHWGRVVTGQLV